MGEEIEMLDVNGRLVRVLMTVALSAIADSLEEGETLFGSRTIEPYRYIQAKLVDDDAVPG